MVSAVGRVNGSNKFSRTWNGVVNVLNTIPEIEDIFSGRTTIGKLSWGQINDSVIKVLKEIDNVSTDLEEAQDSIESHSTNYIVAVCLLAICSVFALFLGCFHFAKLRGALIKFRRGVPVNFASARKNLQELLRLRHLSVGDLKNTIPRHNPNVGYPSYPNIQLTFFGKPTYNVTNVP